MGRRTEWTDRLWAQNSGKLKWKPLQVNHFSFLLLLSVCLYLAQFEPLCEAVGWLCLLLGSLLFGLDAAVQCLVLMSRWDCLPSLQVTLFMGLQELACLQKRRNRIFCADPQQQSDVVLRYSITIFLPQISSWLFTLKKLYSATPAKLTSNCPQIWDSRMVWI